ncbi:crustacyanin-A1 subunit-like, partial [Hyalella azteca]|uniref:Crustacyanin-A1 subunit-like n=1 Tax=Hyalella azteca TaxID=294128 RepID=A0A8B7NVY1_HYAAZ
HGLQENLLGKSHLIQFESNWFIQFIILDTDYENYACLYSCLQRFTFKAEFVWVLSRAPVVTQSFVRRCRELITTESGFDWRRLHMVEQGETCPYWEDHLQEQSKESLESKTELQNMVNAVDDEVKAIINEEIEFQEDDIFYYHSSSGPQNTGFDFRLFFIAIAILFF